MMKDQLITLFDKPIEKMNRNELKREYKVQRYMLRYITKFKMQHEYLDEHTDKPSTVREDKIEYFTNFERALTAQTELLKHYMDFRTDELSVPYSELHPSTRRARRKRRLEIQRAYALQANARNQWKKKTSRDGINLSWDKEKFLAVARDRGYQTEEAVVYAIGQELNIDRTAAALVLKTGRCTWGQVLCIGALMEMSPKEFCDIFLAGYFVERFGDYVASYENIDKSALLKRTPRGTGQTTEEPVK